MGERQRTVCSACGYDYPHTWRMCPECRTDNPARPRVPTPAPPPEPVGVATFDPPITYETSVASFFSGVKPIVEMAVSAVFGTLLFAFLAFMAWGLVSVLWEGGTEIVQNWGSDSDPSPTRTRSAPQSGFFENEDLIERNDFMAEMYDGMYEQQYELEQEWHREWMQLQDP